MIVGFIIELAIGMLCVVLGGLIWKKQKITYLHEYHYKNVKKTDIPAYTRLIGIGLIVIGVGIYITGFFNLAESSFWWIPILIGFSAGLLTMHVAQKKYNGGWFS